MKPIAAIDVGTNSFHLVIASVTDKGVFRVHSRDKESVRLGESMGDMKYLTPDAIARGVLALKRFARAAQQAGAEVRAIATSAVREAMNRDEFQRQAKLEAGIDVEVVSGYEEARLIYLGVLQALPIVDVKSLIVDIGGGSTETVIGIRGDMLYAYSAKLGAIRMTKQFFADEKLLTKNVKECREYIRGEWALVWNQLRLHGFQQVIGSSGTIQTIARMALAKNILAKGGMYDEETIESINGTVISAKDIRSVVDDIIEAKTYKKISALPGMDAKRADIILGGALIIDELLNALNIKEIGISEGALREGILIDTFQKKQSMEKYHHLSNLRNESIRHLAEICRVNIAHAEHVKNLALQIFHGLQPLHGLNDSHLELLEAAALLHDVGYHISSDQHHKHSYYIIRNADLLGFTRNEEELIANIARYHRKSHPKLKHENLQKLPQDKRGIMAVLAAILRIAEGLDRRQTSMVRDVTITIHEKKIVFGIRPTKPSTPPDVEIWGAERRKSLLEELYSRAVIFESLS